jgi:hypothetical protein
MSRLIVFGLLVAAACKSSPPPAPAPAAPRESTVRARVPLLVSWQEVRRGPTGAELVARVQRLAPLPFSIDVSVSVPSGVKLARGRAQFTLTPNVEGEIHEESIAITYEKLPETDLELTAHGQAPDMGVHARMPYRFGRREPLNEAVAPVGPDLQGPGDRNLGPSIPISAQAP